MSVFYLRQLSQTLGLMPRFFWLKILESCLKINVDMIRWLTAKLSIIFFILMNLRLYKSHFIKQFRHSVLVPRSRLNFTGD